MFDLLKHDFTSLTTRLLPKIFQTDAQLQTFDEQQRGVGQHAVRQAGEEAQYGGSVHRRI